MGSIQNPLFLSRTGESHFSLQFLLEKHSFLT